MYASPVPCDPSPLILPVAGDCVRAGFPSPAEDFQVERLDLCNKAIYWWKSIWILVEKHLDESNRRAQELNAEKRRTQQLYAEKLQECITAQIPLPTCKERAQKLAFPNGLGGVKLPD